MSQPLNLLEALWAAERVIKSVILSPEEKQQILAEITHSLPPEMICSMSPNTLSIVTKYLLGTSINPDEDTIVRRKGHKAKEEAPQKAGEGPKQVHT